MKLYEIDREIGELLDRISALQEERDRKLIGITKHILNVRSDAEEGDDF